MKFITSLPKVSVCVVTYNQEKYIRQCLQSIVSQITNFEFEVIVGDDSSTDGTQAIIRTMADEYPGKILPFFHKVNIGPNSNYLFVHAKAIGEYIAHVDGDDYCLPGKLQAQANVLDKHADCNIVWHRMLVQSPQDVITEGSFRKCFNLEEMEFGRNDIIQYISIGANSSKMYRKSVREISEPDFEMVDYFANVEQVSNGHARFTGHVPYGVYRSGIGISSDGIYTRKLLAKCFIYFYLKYPQYRLQINIAALTYLIRDIKNFRKSWPLFFGVWIKTFHIGSIPKFISSLKFMKNLKYH